MPEQIHQGRTITPKALKQAVKLRARNGRLETESLYVDFIQDGKRKTERLKLSLFTNPHGAEQRQHNKNVMQMAEAIRQRKEADLRSRQHGFVAGYKREADFIAYLDHLAETHYPNNTSWPSAIKALRDFHPDRRPFKDVTPEWLTMYRNFLLAKKSLSTNSARLYFRHLKTALNRAVKERIIAVNPFIHVDQIRGVESERTYLSIEEVQAIARVETQHSETKRAFLFAIYTGLRISDIITLVWRSVNMQTRQIYLVPKKTRNTQGKSLYVELSDTALRLLGEPGNATQKVFKLPTDSNVQKHIVKIARLAGIDRRITFHVARHTAATLMLANGTDIYTVSKILGHSDISITQVYAKVLDSKKQAAVNSIPKIEI